MTTNTTGAGPNSGVASARSKAGSPRVGRPRGIVPTVAAPWRPRASSRLRIIARTTGINGPGAGRGGGTRPARDPHTYPPGQYRHAHAVAGRNGAQRIHQHGQGLLAWHRDAK